MLIAEICEIYGWTYDEYMSQPDFFLELVHNKLRIDRKKEEMQAKKFK